MSHRSSSGQGRLCGIYTLGVQDPYAREYPETYVTRPKDAPILTASIGEDFADCRWPVTVKAQADVSRERLSWFLTRLYQAIDEGFFMDPAIGPAIYWRWSGTMLPGLSPEDDDTPSDTSGARFAEGTTPGARSVPGSGPLCGIYLVDDADTWRGEDFYGRIHGDSAVSGSVGEDYAASKWPLVVKVHAGIDRERLCEHLTALIACVEDGMFFDVAEHDT